jgi:hypothetical protein
MGLTLPMNYSKLRFFNLAIASSAARLPASEVTTALCFPTYLTFKSHS